MNRIINTYRMHIVWAFGLFTILRLFVGNAAFPFFNNVDEHAHFDLIIKYSQGHLPTKESKNFNEESARLISLYDSPEYFYRPESYDSKQLPLPTWMLIEDKRNLELEKEMKIWKGTRNHEEFSPPLYYCLAAGWYKIGKMIGMKGGHSLYWIRFLNILIYGILFGVTYYFVRYVFRESISMQLSILSLLAVFPQDVFYSLNSDVLTPLFALLSFVLLLKIYYSEASNLQYCLAGLLIAFAFLSKISNVSLYAIAGLILFLRIKEKFNSKRFLKEFALIFLLVTFSLISIIPWFIRNVNVLGDLMGTADKIHELGWTLKPVSEIFNHPIFSWEGVSYMFSNIFKTFWRGEFVWGMRRLASSNSDAFYLFTTPVFTFVSVFNTFILNKENDTKLRFIKFISIVYIILSILFLIVLSMIYDFGTCLYPSRERPFFASGRLILGVLVPFLILYVDGLNVILEKISKRFNLFFVVFLMSIFISHYETVSLMIVIKSKYNWFHL